MIFKSTVVKAQWDNWCYYYDHTYYLYYLITERSGGEGIGVATSKDGVHWADHGWMIRASDKMVDYLGTGSVWKAADFEKTGRFLCNYSEWRVEPETGKKTQNILFASSTDLIHWTKLGDETMFRVDDRWYDRYGRWDCIYPIPRAEGGYWGVWTATAKPDSPRQGTVGFGYSEDGLRWTALEAPEVTPGVGEAGAFWRFGKRYYAMFGADGAMWSYVADKVGGPYRRSAKNALLLHPDHTYFSRFFPLPDGTVLVNHQSNSEWGWHIAPFKRAVIDREGTLRLDWWKGNDALKGEPATVKPRASTERADHKVPLTDPLDFDRGVLIEGAIRLPERNAGMTPVLALELDNGRDYEVKLDHDGRTEFAATGSDEKTLLHADRERSFPEKTSFRLLARRGMLEFYLDDELMACVKLEGALGAKTISPALIENPEKPLVARVKVWRMSLPALNK